MYGRTLYGGNLVRKVIVAAACAALLTAGACRKVSDGQLEYEKPVVGTQTDTATVPTLDVTTDSTKVTVPNIDVKKDSAKIKIPKIKVNTAEENKKKAKKGGE
jgi:hypothetical protein